MTVADTDVLIDFLQGKGPGADPVAAELERGNLCTTVITRFELGAGAKTPKQRRSVDLLLNALPALSLDEAAADAAAGVRRSLESIGCGIGMADSLIAGIVMRHGDILLTRNRRHFERVEGLRLADIGDS